MPDRPALPFRVLRRGLLAASRASAAVVDHVLKTGVQAGPAVIPADGPARPRAAPDAPVEIRFDHVVARVERGATLLEAAVQAGVDLRSYCGGNCSCGTCRVEIVRGARNLSRRESMEEFALGTDAAARGDRLACQAQLLGDVEVHVPEWF